MDGRPRRGRRRRQSPDQTPAHQQGTVLTSEQTIGPPEEAPPLQAQDATVASMPEETAVQPPPVVPYTEASVQPQAVEQPLPSLPQVVQTPPPAPQQPPPAHRGEQRQGAGHRKGGSGPGGRAGKGRSERGSGPTTAGQRGPGPTTAGRYGRRLVHTDPNGY
jgi:hypothetical protein